MTAADQRKAALQDAIAEVKRAIVTELHRRAQLDGRKAAAGGYEADAPRDSPGVWKAAGAPAGPSPSSSSTDTVSTPKQVAAHHRAYAAAGSSTG